MSVMLLDVLLHTSSCCRVSLVKGPKSFSFQIIYIVCSRYFSELKITRTAKAAFLLPEMTQIVGVKQSFF